MCCHLFKMSAGTKAARPFWAAAVVAGDPYVLTVHLPQGFRLEKAEVGGEKAEIAQQQETATVRIVPTATKAVEWKMSFAKWRSLLSNISKADRRETMPCRFPADQ